MNFNTYEEASKGMKEEHLDIMDNVLLPVLTGQSVIHIRTHEEDRVVGICEAINSRLSTDFAVLHVLTEAGVESSLLDTLEQEGDDLQFRPLSTAAQNGESSAQTSLHVRALTSFLSTPEGGILLVLGADRACRQTELVRRLKIHAKNGLIVDELGSGAPKLVVLHTISEETPETLSRSIQNYDLPLPRDGTLSASLLGVCEELEIGGIGDVEVRKDWVRALRGLTAVEAERSLQQTFTVHGGQLSQESLIYLQTVKRSIIKQTGIMEFHEPTTSFSDIGGLGNLVEDLNLRRGEFEINAREAGIQSPKGCLLVGLPGTGKSLIAQSVAGEWHLPMLEFNMANVLDSYVGSSEQNIKKILSVAESMAPCVLMVDEIDKALSGLGSSGGDSGVTRRVIGSFLTWLSDRKSEVYVIATANDLTEIATAMPEMLRKGRWDDIWWVDLPDQDTRERIIEIHLKKIPSDRIEKEVWNQITTFGKLNSGVTGAELAAAVNDANRISFHNGGLLNVEQLTTSINSVKPLASGIRGLEITRKWMKDFARPASPNKAADVDKNSEIYLSGFDASKQFKSSKDTMDALEHLAELVGRMNVDDQE